VVGNTCTKRVNGFWPFGIDREKAYMAQLEAMDKSLSIMGQLWVLVQLSEDHVINDVTYLATQP
jgi:hypothetical protein